MDFSITEDQSMLQDSVAKFIQNDYDFEARQQAAASDQGFSSERWQTFAELGLTAVPFSESDGGLDGGAVELMLLMEEFGKGLVIEPYLPSIIMAGGAIKRLADDAQKESWLHPLIDGSKSAALAYAEPQSRYNITDVTLSAVDKEGGYVLNGNKTVVLNGGNADTLVVSARTSGERTDADGISLFVVAADAPGIKRKSYPTVDARQAAEISFENVLVGANAMLGDKGNAAATLSAVLDDAIIAVCAEAVGIMQVLNYKTLEYTKSRVQFGKPIASFQALQHRMVDMFVIAEQTRSLLLHAVMACGEDDALQRETALRSLKIQIGTEGRKLGEEAVQLHGGMGVTWELDVAHYFKRLTMIDTLFGNASYHLEHYPLST
ncbi:MAG: acyl-CoA dehydrogenase family protein [Pseudomonadota bacterium]